MTRGERYVGASVALATLLTCIAGPWITVLSRPEHPIVHGWRIVAALTCFGVMLGFGLKRRIGVIEVSAAGLVLLSHILVLYTLAVLSGAETSVAVLHQNEAARLTKSIGDTDNSPYVPWIDGRSLKSAGLIRDDSTLVDALEILSFYANGIWYLSVVCSAVLVILAYRSARTGRTERVRLARNAAWLLVACIALLVPSCVGHFYWERSRDAESKGDLVKAIRLLKLAAFWDRRLDYDIDYHFDLGRCHGEINDRTDPDYVTAVADEYLLAGKSNTQLASFGTRGYTLRLKNVNANPTIPTRMAFACLRAGLADMSLGRDLSAEHHFEKGLHLEPDDLELLWGLASARTANRNFESAIPTWLEVVKLNESVGLYRYKIFVTLTFRKMITARAYSALAYCYLGLGDPVAATRAKFDATQASNAYLKLPDQESDGTSQGAGR